MGLNAKRHRSAKPTPVIPNARSHSNIAPRRSNVTGDTSANGDDKALSHQSASLGLSREAASRADKDCTITMPYRVMRELAKRLSDADIQALADYYAGR